MALLGKFVTEGRPSEFKNWHHFESALLALCLRFEVWALGSQLPDSATVSATFCPHHYGTWSSGTVNPRYKFILPNVALVLRFITAVESPRHVNVVSEPDIEGWNMVAIQTLCFLLFHYNLGPITPPTTVDELFMSLAPGGGTGFPYLEVGLC